MPDRNPISPRPYPLPALPSRRRYEESPDASLAAGENLAVHEISDPWDLYTFQISELICKTRTPHQSVIIADSFNYGRILVLDGSIQSASCDERLYHELLVQPAMMGHANPREVLIIGGGEGATLREVLRSRTVERVTMVDIDAELVEICKRHLPTWHRGAFSDPRSTLVFADGREFIATRTQTYDVVIIDIVDMLDNGPAQRLYTRQFYEQVRQRLKPGGILVVQALEFSFNRDKEHVALARTLRTVFSEVSSYAAAVPSFLSTWGFVIASDWLRPVAIPSSTIDRTIAQRIGGSGLMHVDGDFLHSCFTLTKETRFLLSQPGPILEDGIEFVAPPRITEADEALCPTPLSP